MSYKASSAQFQFFVNTPVRLFAMIMFEGQIMTPPDLDINHFKQLLLHLRDEILQSEHSGKEGVQPVELDQTTVGRVSRMDALQGQAMAQAAQQRRHIQLQRIETALRRIENGQFGWCLRCGEAIAPKRLDFDATAPLCIDCANSGTP